MTHDQIAELLTSHLQTVLALEERPDRHASFADDLHADSLDLVEVLEHVESDLRGRGLDVAVADDVLRQLRTVDEAIDAVVAAVQQTSGADR